MDFFEEFYLLFDSAAALLGSPFHYKQLLYAVLFEEVSPDKGTFQLRGLHFMIKFSLLASSNLCSIFCRIL